MTATPPPSPSICSSRFSLNEKQTKFFPSWGGKTVPCAGNPLFPALGKVGSISSFWPQGKCHLPRKAFPDDPITPRVIVYYIMLPIPFWAVTRNCNDGVYFWALFIVPLDFKLQKDKSHFCGPLLSVSDTAISSSACGWSTSA